MLKNQNQESIDQFQMQSLNLDFKKKQNKKSATQRVSLANFNGSKTLDLLDYSSNKKSHTPNKSEKQNLIQKKKSYAQQIRQRHVQQLQNKKKKKLNDQNEFSQIFQKNQSQNQTNIFKDNSNKSNGNQPLPMCNAFKQTNRIFAPSCSKNHSKAKKINNIRHGQNQNIKLFQNQANSKKVSNNFKVNLFQKNQKDNQNNYSTKHISKSASRHIKQKKEMISLQSMYLNQSIKLDQQQDFQTNKSLMTYFTPNNDRQTSKDFKNVQTSCFFLQPSCIQPIQQLSAIQKIQLHSSTVDICIQPSLQHQNKRKQAECQLNLLIKQNGTFKKQLAQFRKQNGVVKKQLQQAKNHIKNLEEKAEKLLENQKLYKENLKNSIQLKQKCLEQENSQIKNLDGILQTTSQQLFGLKNQNKHLEMKVYMLEMKLFQQEQSNKKKLATEINKWKEKYNQMRFELLKVKNQKNYSSDWSISMDISRDE